MKYHCYTEYREAVYTSDVVAITPEGAAVQAAREHGIAGAWTVIEGEPVTVEVVSRTEFEIPRKEVP